MQYWSLGSNRTSVSSSNPYNGLLSILVLKTPAGHGQQFAFLLVINESWSPGLFLALIVDTRNKRWLQRLGR